jgi:hypothetical protein
MSPETQAAAGRTGEIGCWCYGRATSQQALVHLSNHPVVAIGINCLHFPGRRFRDYQATVMRRLLRACWISDHSVQPVLDADLFVSGCHFRGRSVLRLRAGMWSARCRSARPGRLAAGPGAGVRAHR